MVLSKSELQVVEDGVFLQQFPYPCFQVQITDLEIILKKNYRCFQRNNFLSGLYTIQLLPVVI